MTISPPGVAGPRERFDSCEIVTGHRPDLLAAA
jgi:hypothetical protein